MQKSGLFFAVIEQMKSMKYPMINGRQQYGCGPRKYYAAEQCVKRREQLSGVGGHAIYRPHSRQDHGRVQQRIYPGKVSEMTIANDTQAQAEDNHRCGNGPVFHHPKQT